MGGSIGAEVLGPLSAGLLLGVFDWRTSMQILVIPVVVIGIIFVPVSRRVGTIVQRMCGANSPIPARAPAPNAGR